MTRSAPKTSNRKKARSAETAPSEQWETVLAKRTDAPPLRFKGTELAWHGARVHDDPVSFCLWKRKTGGVVVSADVAGTVESASLDDIESAMDWLEEHCGPGGQFGLRNARDLTTFERVKTGVRHRELRILVGHVLDQWDRLSEREPL